jgi:hypothetical protein
VRFREIQKSFKNDKEGVGGHERRPVGLGGGGRAGQREEAGHGRWDTHLAMQQVVPRNGSRILALRQFLSCIFQRSLCEAILIWSIVEEFLSFPEPHF